MDTQSSPSACAWLVTFCTAPRLNLKLFFICRKLRSACSLSRNNSRNCRIDILLLGITIPVKNGQVSSELSMRRKDSDSSWTVILEINEKCSRSYQNGCSPSIRTGVHDAPESVFTFDQNMHHISNYRRSLFITLLAQYFLCSFFITLPLIKVQDR